VTVVVAGRVLGFEMDISHIVTNGCSFTYCQGLPIRQGWPALLANKLNCPLVNLGLPGSGNDSIQRRTYEYIYGNLKFDNKPLVIIGWSQPWRREAWLDYKNSKRHYPFPEYYTLRYADDKVDNGYEQGILDHWSEEDHYRRATMSKLVLITLCESLSIPYIMSDFMEQRNDEPVAKLVDKKFPEITEKVYSNQYYAEPVYLRTNKLPKLPCGHDGIEAQIATSNYLHEHIRKIYPNLNFTKDKEFYKLKDFAEVSKLYRKFPEWCTFQLKSDILP
jgi:hypothetical protein